jgi:hypothetical protein
MALGGLPKAVPGVTFTNGVEVTDAPAQNAAWSRRIQIPA